MGIKKENMNSQRKQAVWFVLLAAVLWSSGGLLIKSVSWHPLAISGARSAIAAIIVAYAFRNEKISWTPTMLIGACSYAGIVLLFVSATKLTTAANAIFLQYTAPIYVALLGSWLLKEKTTSADWLTIVVVFAGMGLFFVDKVSEGNWVGNLLAIASGISFAIFVICMRKQQDSHPFASVLVGNIITFFVGLPFIVEQTMYISNWGIILILGIFQLGIPYVLYTKAIQQVSALESIMIPVIEPVLNPIWVFFLLGENPGMWSIVGGLIILTAITGRYLIAAYRKSP